MNKKQTFKNTKKQKRKIWAIFKMYLKMEMESVIYLLELYYLHDFEFYKIFGCVPRFYSKRTYVHKIMHFKTM